ncbi:DUF4135 domain-containing protein [Undibacterium sp. Ji49W]|uniref:DUF4135 domain-containing protein n=1 Tax=Undibacterium sp. Ji49W TaxID=3413040 RepID=UPI003BF3EA37
MAEQAHQNRKKADGDQQSPLTPLQTKAKLQQHSTEFSPGSQTENATQFVDQRPQARQLAAYSHMMQNSPRAAQLRAMQGMMNKPALQRVEDEALQAQSADQGAAQLIEQVESPSVARPNNTGLPNQLKAGIESLSGMRMDHVKVNYNSGKPAQLNAHAYAQGSEIHVAPGQERHVPHEAWHVVQQAQGRVRPTMQMKQGIPVNDDAGLETEADVMGAKALGVGKVAGGKVVQNAGVGSGNGNGNQRIADSGAVRYSGLAMPYQLIRFKPDPGFWNYLSSFLPDQKKDEILAQEKKVKMFLEDMKTFENTTYGEHIRRLRENFELIEKSTVATRDFSKTLLSLKGIYLQLDQISVRMAKAFVLHDSVSGDWVEEGYEGVNSSLLIRLVSETYLAANPVFQTEKNKEVLRTAILGELGSYKFRNADVKPEDLEFARKRVESLTKNLKKMLTRILIDWSDLRREFGLSEKLLHVHLTGSDYHNDGQSVSIVESDDGKKVVYKPRSLSPDIHLVGNGETNLRSALNLGFSTAKFSEKERGAEKYGYMEHLSRAKLLTEEEAKNYYRQMGSMIIATKLLGVTDLHQENIFTSRGGVPMIVDAETSFLPDVMMAEAWDSTLIRSTLREFSKDMAPAPNYFYTIEELEAWKISGKRREGQTEPTGDYISEVRAASYRQGGKYNVDFEEGIRDAISVVYEKKASLITYLQERVKQIQAVRIVPIETLEFKGGLNAYFKKPLKRDELLNTLVGKAKKALIETGYIMAEGSDQVLKNGMIADFNNTDFPIFRYEPATDQVFYRGTVIARHRPGIQEAIVISVNHISETKVREVTGEFY